MMDIKEMFMNGIEGKVTYNQDEDSYQLTQRFMDIGLYPIWANFEGQRIRIKVEILNDK